jgi:Arc/MetJ-type ribon-helix-helix transcriptional regulator
MAVISLRLNRNEEKMVEFLSNFYEQDKSALIKYSLRELYEDIIDREAITGFEKREEEGKTSFIPADEILKALKGAQKRG